jgi:hypothetical protein
LKENGEEDPCKKIPLEVNNMLKKGEELYLRKNYV